MLEVFGAEIILTPGAEGSNGAVKRAEALAAEHPEWCFLYQYGNDANPRAHYEGTGPEIWQDCPEITHFVAGLGTSGTLMGTGTFLKEQNPDIKVIAIEPPLGERVEGLRNLDEGYIPPVFDKWHGQRPPRPQARRATARDRSSGPAGSSRSGVFAGLSAGAALAGAVKVAAEIDQRHDRVHRLRRRLEVPLDRRLHRRPRRRRSRRREGHLLLTGHAGPGRGRRATMAR